jgi:hypothetical protein
VKYDWLFGSPKISAPADKPNGDYDAFCSMIMRDRSNQKLYMLNKPIIIILIAVGRIEMN